MIFSMIFLQCIGKTRFYQLQRQYLTGVQSHVKRFFGHTVFLKLRIGQFSDTQKPSVAAAECPKIFDIKCIWGKIFVSLAKIFVFKYSQTIFHLVFMRNMYMWKKCWKNFSGYPHCSNDTKIRLDAALVLSKKDIVEKTIQY